jgi:hypothetical protein
MHDATANFMCMWAQIGYQAVKMCETQVAVMHRYMLYYGSATSASVQAVTYTPRRAMSSSYLYRDISQHTTH